MFEVMLNFAWEKQIITNEPTCCTSDSMLCAAKFIDGAQKVQLRCALLLSLADSDSVGDRYPSMVLVKVQTVRVSSMFMLRYVNVVRTEKSCEQRLDFTLMRDQW